MIHYKTREEIELIREAALILAKAHGEVAARIRPGVQTKELDKYAEECILDHGATACFKNYRGFPAALCVSVNEQVVHGIPGNYELKETDIVSVDCGVSYKGFYSDSAYTYPLEGVEEETILLLERTYESLEKGIEQAKKGNRIGDIGYAIQEHVQQFGYSVVRDLVGHGVGIALHEDPEVPNFGKRGHGPLLKEGMVIAIEPMVNLGTHKVFQEKDEWTICTVDRKPSAHFEHTVAITSEGARVLTTYAEIEKNYKYKWRNKSQSSKMEIY